MLKITIVAMGTKMPSWIMEGTNEYSRRLKENIQLHFVELPIAKRGKSNDLNRLIEKESNLLINALPLNATLIAMDVEGKLFNSSGLAKKMTQLQMTSSHLCFIIGGPEGLSDAVLSKCQERWSLSKLTMPHTLVRIVLLEAIYRAWSMINNHPYHK